MALRERLQSLMEARGIGTNELARRAGVSAAVISNIIHGRSRQPREEIVQALASALGVSPAFLRGYSLPPEISPEGLALAASYESLPRETRDLAFSMITSIITTLGGGSSRPTGADESARLVPAMA